MDQEGHLRQWASLGKYLVSLLNLTYIEMVELFNK